MGAVFFPLLLPRVVVAGVERRRRKRRRRAAFHFFVQRSRSSWVGPSPFRLRRS